MNDQQKSLFEFLLRMGDNYLVLGQRLSELCGHGPILEQDIALTNIALDQLGQARFYLEYAAQCEGRNRTDDDMAFFRDVNEYRNALLVEQPNGDFAFTLARQFLFDQFNHLLVSELLSSSDEQIRSISSKSIKEINYHIRFSSDWMLRLGDGTKESHHRLQDAINQLWRFTDDLFVHTREDQILIEKKIIPEFSQIKKKWDQKIKLVLDEATITIPESNYMMKGSREGQHTEHLGFILADLQFMPRTYPGATW